MLIPVLFAAATFLSSYLYTKVTKLRYLRFAQYEHIPQLPTSLLWGHLKTLGELTKRGTNDRHPDKIFEEMWEAKGKPPIMFVDLRPVSAPMLLVTTHEVAEQVSRPSKLFPLSPTKSPTWTHMAPIIGMTSILAKEGHEWKDLRRRYTPGFTSRHLWTLLPLILEKTKPFIQHLDHFAATNQVFPIETIISNLTFDIIGAAVLYVDLNAQHLDRSQQGEVIRLLWELLRTYADDKNNLPWWLIPRVHYKRRRLGKRIDTLVRALVCQKYAEAKSQRSSSSTTKDISSIVALSFQDSDTETLLTPSKLTETSDQVRTFLFAGHDSLTSSLQWAFYELSRTPRALQAVRKELDSVLGPETDPAAICARLLSHSEDIFPKMKYINAVIKETLRLHPPASTVRMAAPGSGFTLRTSATDGQKDYLVDGLILYSCQSIIQRDPAVYGDNADKWVPERWLEKNADIPAAAWRPFERGPRNCMGQELANLESRVIIAIVARKYEFVKVGLGESVSNDVDEYGQFKVREELYNTRRVTAKPVDGTLMPVKLASPS
ncbi:cytochrome P450 [Rhypophila decipiens]|uniref:Cytochrome P450 n=1 Tax=Rhypophila decipiens TaxID=261697 RepID=A0AAN7B1X7_9PEZI|nr:cytochrome P450 [Rhypophila decipiens]